MKGVDRVIISLVLVICFLFIGSCTSTGLLSYAETEGILWSGTAAPNEIHLLSKSDGKAMTRTITCSPAPCSKTTSLTFAWHENIPDAARLQSGNIKIVHKKTDSIGDYSLRLKAQAEGKEFDLGNLEITDDWITEEIDLSSINGMLMDDFKFIIWYSLDSPDQSGRAVHSFDEIKFDMTYYLPDLISIETETEQIDVAPFESEIIQEESESYVTQNATEPAASAAGLLASPKKIQGDRKFDAIIDSTEMDGTDLIVTFHHNSPIHQPIKVIGKVQYEITKNSSVRREPIQLRIKNWDNKYFRIKIGKNSEVIEFGTPDTQTLTLNLTTSSNEGINVLTEITDVHANQLEINQTVNGEDSIEVSEGVYDVKLILQDSPIQEIVIENLDMFESSTQELGIDLPENKQGYDELYAIDPTRANFTSATVKVIATSTKLYKCKDWNFSTQTCFGDWKLLRNDLIPGQEYNFTLTLEDPGFAEGVLTTVCKIDGEFESCPTGDPTWETSDCNKNNCPYVELSNTGCENNYMEFLFGDLGITEAENILSTNFTLEHYDESRLTLNHDIQCYDGTNWNTIASIPDTGNKDTTEVFDITNPNCYNNTNRINDMKLRFCRTGTEPGKSHFDMAYLNVLTDGPRVEINQTFKDPFGNEINTSIEIFDEENNLIYNETKTKHSKKIKKAKKHKLKFRPKYSQIQEIEITGLSPDQDISQIFEYQDEFSNAEITTNYCKSYAINPLTTNFTNMTITSVAKGYTLHKCTEYDFANENCYGAWPVVRNLTIGEVYSYTIDPYDPIINEAGPCTCNGVRSIEITANYTFLPGLEYDLTARFFKGTNENQQKDIETATVKDNYPYSLIDDNPEGNKDGNLYIERITNTTVTIGANVTSTVVFKGDRTWTLEVVNESGSLTKFGPTAFHLSCSEPISIGMYDNGFTITELDAALSGNCTRPMLVTCYEPPNGTTIYNSPIELYYNVSSDNTSIQNCSLFVNGELNQTAYWPSENEAQNFTLGFTPGYHNWSIECYDSSHYSNTSNLCEFNFAEESSDLSITKTDYPDPVYAGDQYTYNITIRNDGSGVAYNLSMFDTLPTYTWFVSSTPNPNIENDTWYFDNLSSGELMTVNITVQTDSNTPNGTVVHNTALLNYYDLLLGDKTINGTENTTILQPPRELNISKIDWQDPIQNGSYLNYTISVENINLYDVFNANLTEVAYPNWSEFISASPSPNEGNDLWHFNLSAGETYNVTVSVFVGLPEEEFCGPLLENESDKNVTQFLTPVNFTMGANINNHVAVSWNPTKEAIEPTAVQQDCDPTVVLSKTDDPDPVYNGSYLTYTIDLDITSSHQAKSVRIYENYDPNVSFISAVPAPDVGTNNEWFFGNLKPGVTKQINITVLVNGSMTNSSEIHNNINMTYKVCQNWYLLETDENTTVLAPFEPELKVVKTDDPDPVYAGELLDYSLNITNYGSGDAYNVIIFEDYPANVSFVSSTPTPTTLDNAWNIGTLLSGESYLINITVQVDSGLMNGSLLYNTVSVNYTGEQGNNRTTNTTENTTVIRPPVNLSVSKTDYPDPVYSGAYLNYTIDLTNTGTETAYNVLLTDVLPGEVSYVSANPNPTIQNDTWNIGQFNPGDTFQINMTVLVNYGLLNGTILTNNVLVNYTGNLGINKTINASENTTVLDPNTNLIITKTDSPDPITNGSHLEYTIQVTNTGMTDITNAIITDQLPNGASFVTSNPNPTIQNNSWTTNILAGQTTEINMTVIVGLEESDFGFNTNQTRPEIYQTPNGPYNVNTQIINHANVTWNGNTSNTNETTTVLLEVDPTMQITKTDDPDPVYNGTILNYTITINFTGKKVAQQVIVTDLLDQNVTYLTSTPAPDPGTQHNWSFGNLQTGETRKINISVLVNADMTKSSEILNQAHVTYKVANTWYITNTTENTTVINPPKKPANLSVTKTDDPDPVFAGDTFNYTITVVNNGPGTAYDILINEYYPENISYVSSIPAPFIGNNVWNVSKLLINESFQIDLTVRALSTIFDGTIVENNVIVTYSDDVSNKTTNTTENTTILNPSYQLIVNKSDNPDPVWNGSLFTYTLNVTNNGTNNAYDINLTETYPLGVDYVSASPAPDYSNDVWIFNLSAGDTYVINVTVRAAIDEQELNYISAIPPWLESVFELLGGDYLFVGNANVTNVVNVSEVGDHEITTIYKNCNVSAKITKTDYPDPVFNGSLLNYTINVTYLGSCPAGGVEVRDRYDTNVTYVSSTPLPKSGTDDTWSFGNMTYGETRQINLTVLVDTDVTNGTILHNEADLAFKVYHKWFKKTATEPTTVIVPEANLIINKSDNPDPVWDGSYFNYILNVTNTGTGTANNVNITDYYPPGVEFVNADPFPDYSNNVWYFDLNPGNSFIVNVTVRADVEEENMTWTPAPFDWNQLFNFTYWETLMEEPTVINASVIVTNLANLSTGQYDKEETTILQNCNATLNITKSDNPDPILNNSYLDYQINYSYSGNCQLREAVVNDPLYDVFSQYVSATPAPDFGTTDTWTIGNMSDGDYGQINLTVLVGVTVPNTTNIPNMVAIKGNVFNTMIWAYDTENTTILPNELELLTFLSNPEPPVIYESSNTYDFSVITSNPELVSDVRFVLNGGEVNGSLLEGTLTVTGDTYTSPVIRGLPVGNHTITWYANDTDGNEFNYSFSYVVLYHSYDNPLDLDMQTKDIATGDPFTVISNYQPTGMDNFTDNDLAELDVIIYQKINGTLILVENSSNYDYVSPGVFETEFNSSGYVEGNYIAVVRMTTNESGLSQTLESAMSFSVQNKNTIETVGAWFTPNETIIVEALYKNKNGQSITNANCQISIVNESNNLIYDSLTMHEILIGGVTHYVFNQSALGLSDGLYYGHVECIQNGISTFSKVEFQVRDFELSATLNQEELVLIINSTRNILKELIQEQYEFSQEEIYLITDSFNSLSIIMEEAATGTVTDTSYVKYKQINQTLTREFGNKIRSLEAKIEPAMDGSGTLSKPKSEKTNYVLYLIGILIIATTITYYRQKIRDALQYK